MLYSLHNICFENYIFRRKRFPNCRWQSTNARERERTEYYPGCTNRTLGDARFVRQHSGACNNLHKGKEHYGLFGIPFSRLLPADYAGKFQIPCPLPVHSWSTSVKILIERKEKPSSYTSVEV